MRNSVLALFVFLTAILFGSCGDLLETSKNGKLDGHWQLKRVDTLLTGGSLDVTQDRKYLAVQGSFFELHDADVGERYMFRFSHTGSQIVLSDARLNNRTLGDPELKEVSALVPYGIHNLSETFEVEMLSGGKLVLRTSELRLTYRKF